MANLIAIVIKAILLLCGLGRKLRSDERHERTAKNLGTLEVKQKDLREALKASEKARKAESLMHAQQKNIKKCRKAKSGDKLFMLFVLLFAVSGLIRCASLHHSPPPQAAVVVCPEIPLPERPQLPQLAIPAKQDNYYCFTQDEMDQIVEGIDSLKNYSETLENTIKNYNKFRKEK